jgi:hypothetical protein
MEAKRGRGGAGERKVTKKIPNLEPRGGLMAHEFWRSPEALIVVPRI